MRTKTKNFPRYTVTIYKSKHSLLSCLYRLKSEKQFETLKSYYYNFVVHVPLNTFKTQKNLHFSRNTVSQLTGRMLAAQYRFSVPWSRYSWALYNISHALCFACGQNMAAASDGWLNPRDLTGR